jgi:hypothetical protein
MPYDIINDADAQFESFLSGLLLNEHMKEGLRDLETFEQSDNDEFMRVKEVLELNCSR